MPTLNRIRLVNIKYNDDKRIVRDELLTINGLSTLALLENGGGKSVLTKFMMQPIMWIYDQYPNTRVKEPYFDMKKYFKTNTEPCYVLEEFILENNEGYLLLGVGIKKGEEGKPLTKIAFVHHYKNKDDAHSIRNIQLFTTKDDVKLLLGLDEVRKSLEPYMETYKSGDSQSKKDFRKHILEYHINISEWEKIHARIVSMEGGLAEIFDKTNTKTTKDLLRNWILEAIEGKIGYINDEVTQISQIQTNLSKYIQDKIASKADMEQLNLLRQFVEDIDKLYDLMVNKEELTENYETAQNNLIHLCRELLELLGLVSASLEECDTNIESAKENINQLKYQRSSYGIKSDLDKLDGHIVELNHLGSEKEGLHNEKQVIERRIKKQRARKVFDELNETLSDTDAKQEALIPLAEKVKELDEKTKNIKYTIKQLCQDEITALTKESDHCNEKETEYNKEYNAAGVKIAKGKDELQKNQTRQTELTSEAAGFETERNRILTQHPDIPARFVYRDFIEESAVKKYQGELYSSSNALTISINALMEEEPVITLKHEQAGKDMHSDELLKQKRTIDYDNVNQDYDTYILEKGKISEILRLYHFKNDAINEKEVVIQQLNKLIDEKESFIKEEEMKQDKILEQIDFYKNDQLRINPLIEKSLKRNGIDYILGLSYLKNSTIPMESKINLIRQVPVLPYAILVSEGKFEKITKIVQKEFTDAVLPVLVKEKLEGYHIFRQNSLFIAGDKFGLYAGYNEELIDEAFIKQQLVQAETALSLIKTKIERLKIEKDELNTLRSNVMHYPYDNNTESQLLAQLKELKEAIEVLTSSISRNTEIYNNTKIRITEIRTQIGEKEKEFTALERKLTDLNRLLSKSDAYYHVLTEKESIASTIGRINAEIEKVQAEVNEIVLLRANNNNAVQRLMSDINKIRVEDAEYLNYSEVGELELTQTGEMKSKNVLKETLRGYQNMTEYTNVTQIQEDINKLQQRAERQKSEFEHFGLSPDEIKSEKYQREILDNLTDERDRMDEKIGKVEKRIAVEEHDVEILEDNIAKAKTKCEGTFYKPYDPTAKNMDYETSILSEQNNIAEQEKERHQYLSTEKDIKRILPSLDKFKDMPITNTDKLVAVDMDNFEDTFRINSDLYRDLEKHLSEVSNKIDKLFGQCENKYIVKQDNKMIGNYLAKMNNYPKSSIFKDAKNGILSLIEYYSKQEETLNKEFEEIYGTSLEYVKKVHEQLMIVDKNSKIDGKKLFELSGILKEGSDERFMAFLNDVVDRIVTGTNDMDYLNNAISTYGLLNNYIYLETVQAYALKFNAYDEVKVKFEDTHNGGVCSGAQRTIVAFAIIKSIMYYTNEGLILNNRNSTSFMFLDNPFSVISTKLYLDIFFRIAESFNTTLYSWTDLNKPEIIKKHRNIYSFKLVQVGKKEYVAIKDDVARDSYETINTDYLREDQQQLEFIFN
jgi:hypothetical protein